MGLVTVHVALDAVRVEKHIPSLEQFTGYLGCTLAAISRTLCSSERTDRLRSDIGIDNNLLRTRVSSSLAGLAKQRVFETLRLVAQISAESFSEPLQRPGREAGVALVTQQDAV